MLKLVVRGVGQLLCDFAVETQL